MVFVYSPKNFNKRSVFNTGWRSKTKRTTKYRCCPFKNYACCKLWVASCMYWALLVVGIILLRNAQTKLDILFMLYSSSFIIHQTRFAALAYGVLTDISYSIRMVTHTSPRSPMRINTHGHPCVLIFSAPLMSAHRHFLFVIQCNVLVVEQTNSWNKTMLTHIMEIGYVLFIHSCKQT